eukprot:1026606-Pleurochrysis_carterae.AAC.2
MASMVHGYGVGQYYWGRSISITNIRFAPLIRPILGRLGRILWSADIRLPSARASLHSVPVNLGIISLLFPLKSPSWQMSLPPLWLILLLIPAKKPAQQYSSFAV